MLMESHDRTHTDHASGAPQKTNALREDLALTCHVWKGYESRVQSHCAAVGSSSASTALYK